MKKTPAMEGRGGEDLQNAHKQIVPANVAEIPPPTKDELEKILVVVGSGSLTSTVEGLGFDYITEGALLDDDGLALKPQARSKLEAAHRAGRDFVFVCLRGDRFSIHAIGDLFRTAKVPIPRIETPDPDRFRSDMRREILRCILNLPVEGESPTGPRGIATPLEKVAARYAGISWAWKDWLARGVLTLVSGASGSGKSTAILDILLRIHGGAPLPDGTLPPAELRGKRALLIDSDARAHHQVPELVKGYGTEETPIDLFEILDEDGTTRPVMSHEDSPNLFALLEATLRDQGHWALLIDTATYFAAGAELNNPSELDRWVRPLKKIARDLGIAVILLGHTNGGGTAYGRHLVSSCQICWTLSSNQELACFRSYAAPPAPLSFAFNATGGPLEWVKAGSPPRGASKGLSKLESWLLAHLRDLAENPIEIQNTKNGWSTLLADAQDAGVCTKGKGPFSRALENLIAAGLVEKVDAKGPKGGAFHRYRAVMDSNQ